MFTFPETLQCPTVKPDRSTQQQIKQRLTAREDVSGDQERATAFYFVEKNLNLGYLLLQRQFIVQDLSYFSVAVSDATSARPLLSRVKSALQQMTTLHRVKALLPLSRETLEVYVTKHDKYVERYGLIRKGEQIYLVLDAFYPEIMDSEYYPLSLAQLDVYISQGMWSFETHHNYPVTP